jgi:PST family polysaccharide transporter
MALIGYAVAIPVSLLSGPVIWVLYGTEYANAAPVLAIHIWAGLFVCLGVAQSAWLLNEGHTHVSMVNTVTGAVLNCGLNLLLIPRYGPIGAAVATLASYACAVFAFSFVYRPTRAHAWMVLKALVFRS